MLCYMLVHGQGVARTMIHVLIPRVAHHIRYVSRAGPSQLSVVIVILYLTHAQFTRLAHFPRIASARLK
jgi:hypothetical protein